LARVNSTNVPERLREQLSEEGAMIGDRRVAITLEDDLRLLFRGTKPAKLLDCKCSVSALEGLLDEDKEPFSVNQAYRIREITRLRKAFGAGRWRKQKGVALVRFEDGTIHRVELH